MTRVEYAPGEWRLRISGHAGAVTGGIDPVCAGTSALGWALVEAATDREDYHARLDIDPETALIQVRCQPEEEARRDCRVMMETVLGGLRLIAQTYPDYVKIKEG